MSGGSTCPTWTTWPKLFKGSWKKYGVHAAITAPEKLGQVLAHVLSRCAVKMAGEGQLPAFGNQLEQLARLPLAEREQAFRQMRFPTTPEGKDAAAIAARNVGKLICAGQVGVAGVARVLARQFLLTITESEFFGVLTRPDMVRIFKSEDAARVQLLQAREEVETYINGTVTEFAESMFQKLERVEKPDLPKRDTAEQMEQDADINFDALGDDEDDE